MEYSLEDVIVTYMQCLSNDISAIERFVNENKFNLFRYLPYEKIFFMGDVEDLIDLYNISHKLFGDSSRDIILLSHDIRIEVESMGLFIDRIREGKNDNVAIFPYSDGGLILIGKGVESIDGSLPADWWRMRAYPG